MSYPSIKSYSGKNCPVFFKTIICFQLGFAFFLKSVALSFLVCGYSIAWGAGTPPSERKGGEAAVSVDKSSKPTEAVAKETQEPSMSKLGVYEHKKKQTIR